MVELRQKNFQKHNSKGIEMHIDELDTNAILKVLANRGIDVRQLKDFSTEEIIKELKPRDFVGSYEVPTEDTNYTITIVNMALNEAEDDPNYVDETDSGIATILVIGKARNKLTQEGRTIREYSMTELNNEITRRRMEAERAEVAMAEIYVENGETPP